jgi:hypothetical protein
MQMKRQTPQEALIRTLLERLERIPADSHWAHRASGVRGGLIQTQAALDRGEPVNQEGLEFLLAYGFKLLERAAREKY